MKKLSVLSTLSFSALLLISCTQMKKKDPSAKLSSLMETVEVDDEVFEKTHKTGEYTHEMAEADADDQKIKSEVGAAEIDEELPGSDNDQIPYAKNFLLKKNTKRMQFWVEYFTKKERARFQRFIDNGEEYRHHIEQILVEHGLPKELYFVGLIESGYYLGARSHASAVGPWQFIKGTGSRYGLKINQEFDERQDLFKATRAAAMYFRDLHNVFSSWELALSAYNAGEYGIIRRIMKHGTRDFYQMSRDKQLPSETINYVPKVLAAMHVVNNAKKYGFDIPKKKYRLFDLTELKAVKRNVPLSTIASRLNTNSEILRKLNPELRRNMTPRHFAGTYYLRVPKNKYSYRLNDQAPETEMAAIRRPESRKELNRRTAEVEAPVRKEVENKTPTFHKVRRGETLLSISRKYKMTPRAIAEANDITWRTRVKVGQRLNLGERAPAQARVEKQAVASVQKIKNTKSPIVYKIKKGDNLTDLARIFNLQVSKIKTANNLKRGNVMVGQKIVLPNTRKGIYTVRRGDHLTKVARDLNQPVEALVKLNALKRNTIYPGQKIIVNMD